MTYSVTLIVLNYLLHLLDIYECTYLSREPPLKVSPIYPRHLHCSEPRYYSHKNGETRPQSLASGRVRKFDEDLFSLRVILLCKMTEESHYGAAFSMLPASKFIVRLIAYKTVIIFRLDVHRSYKL